jgi:ubiquinone/menaquinone biosynthesis C-methylase UbiE
MSSVDSLCFDPMADIYDDTRVINEACFNAVLDLIVEKYPPSKYKNLLEPGTGTGRIGIALAERGYQVNGIDISGKMLKVLEDKLKKRQYILPYTFKKADVTALPFSDASFDISVVVHLFHLVRNWQKAVAEVLRVLKPGAPLISFTTGAGLEIPAINDRYRELCAEFGHPSRLIGMTGFPEFNEYLQSLGRQVELIENRWQWTKKNRVDDAFRHIKLRYYGMTRLVPGEIHLNVVRKLERELLEQYGALDTEVEVPSQMRLVFITG